MLRIICLYHGYVSQMDPANKSMIAMAKVSFDSQGGCEMHLQVKIL